MQRTLIPLTLIAATLFLSERAEAQPCCFPPGPVYYRTQPEYHIIYQAPPPPPRWAIGMQLSVMSTNQKLGGEGVVLGGMGGHLRFRGYRWAGEFAADVLGGDFANSRVQRLSVPMQLSAMFYLIPQGVFNLYLIGGIRVIPTHITWDYDVPQKDQNFLEYGFHGGGGFEINCGRRLMVFLDARFFGVMRANSYAEGQYYSQVDSGVVPEKTVGFQFSTGGAIRF
jgi:hypothetical protein